MANRVRKPEWLRINIGANDRYTETKRIVDSHCLHTMCGGGRCPNMGECWGKRITTFMVGGDVYIHSCKSCNTQTRRPRPLDANEPTHVAESIAPMKLDHAVVTPVDRDDLPDLGTGHWIHTVREIKRLNPRIIVEVLIPDFQGRMELVDLVIEASPDIIFHNMETVKRISLPVRNTANCDTSLQVVGHIARSGTESKSGIMAGLGETPQEVETIMDGLLTVSCQILTIGQYLQPTHRYYPVAKYVAPQQLATYKVIGLEKGSNIVESVPLVRSSYHVERHIRQKTKHIHYLFYRQNRQINIKMDHKGALSSTLNTSLGFIPVVISILLCEFIAQDTVIYIGIGIGIIGIYLLPHCKNALIPNFILYIAIGVLALLSSIALIPGDYVPPGTLSLTLKVSILIPMLILYMHKKRLINHFLRQIGSYNKRLCTQGAGAAVVSARFVLIFGILHFIIISIVAASQDPLGQTNMVVPYKAFPPVVFVMSILFNQITIRYFNHLMLHMEYVSIVNMKGDVIGRSLAIEALGYKNAYINPVIRMAVPTRGMLFPCDRSMSTAPDKGRTDIPMECYLRYGKSLTEGVGRLVHNAFPRVTENFKPEFNIVYHFENEVTNRLICLLIIDIKSDSILCTPRLKNSKLWSFK